MAFKRAANTAIVGGTFNDVAGSQFIGCNFDASFSGIIFTGYDRKLSHLPLDRVHANVCMVDVSASITLEQTFTNPSSIKTHDTKYVFPVPSRAAVCAFEMHFPDGRVIKGVSKEKVLAAKEFESAVRAGRTAGLCDWVTDDMFVISVGAIRAKQTVTTKLVFVMELMDDQLQGTVRLQLPMSIGRRYGQDPDPLPTAVSPSGQTCLTIIVEMQMSTKIEEVACPTHPNTKIADGHKSPRRRTAELSSQTFLTQDFVLIVRARALNTSRCFVEYADPDHDDRGTIAMQLTLVSNFNISPISTREYLFLVDRSQSMGGPRIETVKQALRTLLHMLPNERTLFNIFSFGSRVGNLWPAGRPRDESCLRAAIAHVKTMTANYGGTELPTALRSVFQTRNTNISTMVFVLTDGEVHAVDEVISVVSQAAKSATTDAPLRVFSLGIGDTVSTAVIEGMARAGNGESDFAFGTDNITDRCARLLRAVSPYIENVTIDWHIPENLQEPIFPPFSVKFFDSRPVHLGPSDSVQQSPSQLPDIYPGTRFTVYLLTSNRDIPNQVELRGTLSGRDEHTTILIPVYRKKIFKDVLLVHTLCARHLITDLVEDRATLPKGTNSAHADDIRRAAVVQLGERYQLASRYTSFVAVDGTNTYYPSNNNGAIDKDDDSSTTQSSVEGPTHYSSPDNNQSEPSNTAGDLSEQLTDEMARPGFSTDNGERNVDTQWPNAERREDGWMETERSRERWREDESQSEAKKLEKDWKRLEEEEMRRGEMRQWREEEMRQRKEEEMSRRKEEMNEMSQREGHEIIEMSQREEEEMRQRKEDEMRWQKEQVMGRRKEEKMRQQEHEIIEMSRRKENEMRWRKEQEMRQKEEKMKQREKHEIMRQEEHESMRKEEEMRRQKEQEMRRQELPEKAEPVMRRESRRQDADRQENKTQEDPCKRLDKELGLEELKRLEKEAKETQGQKSEKHQKKDREECDNRAQRGRRGTTGRAQGRSRDASCEDDKAGTGAEDLHSKTEGACGRKEADDSESGCCCIIC